MLRRAAHVAAVLLAGALLIPSTPAAGATVDVAHAHSPLQRLRPAAGEARPATNSPHGYLPCDVTNAYHLGTIQAGVNDGAGQTIAVIDPYDDPALPADFAAFSTYFHLPATGLVIDTPYPIQTSAPDYLTWRDEVTLDVEWIHAVAPGATIHWVKAASSADADMVAAIDYAVNQVKADILSLSWTFAEGSGPGQLSGAAIQNYDSHFPSVNGAGKPVVYFASAGDAGFQVNWPAESPRVVGVGGTAVRSDAFGYGFTPGDHTDCTGAVASRAGVNSNSETAWGSAGTYNCSSSGSGINNAYCGTGGGVAAFESIPDFQSRFGVRASGRAIPDVAMLADPATGVATYQNGTWNPPTGGTSLGPPIWAGMAARLNQAKRANLGGVSWLYSVADSAFNDIQTGSAVSIAHPHCTTDLVPCAAGVGYDLLTGRGSVFYDRLLAAVAPSAPPAMPFTYLLPWFDRISDPGFLNDNIHVVNPNPGSAVIKVQIPGCNVIDDTIYGFNEGVYTCDSGFGGPVTVRSSQRLLVSQRVRYWSSFNEAKAVALSDAQPHLQFAWYDMISDPGFASDNIHVLNPQAGDTTVTVAIPGCQTQTSTLHAGAEGIFNCPTGFGGPVKVDGSQPVIAAQRVKYYASFNEVAAQPASGRAPALYLAWYDRLSDPGFKNDNVHVFGPPGTVVDVSIPSISSDLCPKQTGTIPAAGETYFGCAAGFGGPVLVSARGGVNIAATQRVQYNQSFNEVPASTLADAGSTLYLSWFDMLSDVGFAAVNVHVVNPSTTQPASYSVSIPGCSPQQGNLAVLTETVVTCPGGFGGPVVVNTDSTSPPVLASLRVRYWDSFNEVAAGS